MSQMVHAPPVLGLTTQLKKKIKQLMLNFINLTTFLQENVGSAAMYISHHSGWWGTTR